MKTALRRLIARMFESQVKRLIIRHDLKVVAVVGSVGKTSTKMAIARTLGTKYRVRFQEGNYNSELGLPLSVFGLSVPGSLLNPFAWIVRLYAAENQVEGEYPYDVLVLELGTDHPGEIPRFMTYLKPDIGVVTAITPEHMEFFGTLDAVAAEELAIAHGAATILVNADDVASEYRAKYLKAHKDVRTYGVARTDRAFAAKIDSGANLAEGTPVTLLKGGHARIVGLTLNVFGEPAVKAAVAAYAVAEIMGLQPSEIEAGLLSVTPVAGRMRPFSGVGGSTVIDDTYNSSPEAVVAALRSLDHAGATGRRIAVLGTMNELGDASARYHREVGAAAAGVDLLVTIGDMAGRELGPAAVKAGLDPAAFKPADSPYAAGEFLRLLLGAGDVVLVKGSQNRVFAEETTKVLLADPADAQYLVRQSEAWLASKRDQFADAPRG